MISQQQVTNQTVVSQQQTNQQAQSQTPQILSQPTNQSTNTSTIPAPPPPPPMPNLNQPTASLNKSSTAQQSGNNLASALSGAKLKKTPNKDDAKEKISGGGMASMMDEMAKTLARRRAQAEGISNHLNGNCNGDDTDSSRLKNGWDNKKSSPNKDNDNSHSR